MRVGVLPVSAMDGQRVGQPLRKPRSQLPALGLAQLLGKRELDLAVRAARWPARVRRCYHRLRWTHKKNSRGCWNGKNPSSRSLSSAKKSCWKPSATGKEILKRQIRRAQSRITTAERKRRTRRLILIGSYIEHVTQTDPHSLDRLMKGLDSFLERDRDRELFDLAQKKENADGKPRLKPSPLSRPERSSEPCVA